MEQKQQQLDGLKTCSRCQKTQPLTEFYWHKKHNNWNSNCRSCKSEINYAYRKKRGQIVDMPRGGRRSREIYSDGTTMCPSCQSTLPATTEYFYSNGNKLSSYCRLCHNENARQSAEKNKYNKKMKSMIDQARAAGDKELKSCNRCKRNMPSSSFVPYDNGVEIDGKVYFRTYTEICGLCIFEINDKVFSKIEGCIKYARDKQSKRKSKANKTKVS